MHKILITIAVDIPMAALAFLCFSYAFSPFYSVEATEKEKKLFITMGALTVLMTIICSIGILTT